MIMTQKVTYLAFSLHDGKRNVKCLKVFIAEFTERYHSPNVSEIPKED